LHGVLVCPRCGLPLAACEHALGIAWRCGYCHGQSLNFSQFRRMVPEDGANNLWATARERPQTPGQRTRCPECRADMDAVFIPLHRRTAELDICRPCQRLWLDRQEDAQPDAADTLTIAPPARERPRLSLSGLLRRNPAPARNLCEAGLRRAEKIHDGEAKRIRPGDILKAVLLLLVLVLIKWLSGTLFRVR
jgi:Zn-finger nucleic acid-binding protein